MDSEGREFAEIVRQTTGRALSALAQGNIERAIRLIDPLCGAATRIVEHHKMTTEQAGGYDLAALAVNMEGEHGEEAE